MSEIQVASRYAKSLIDPAQEQNAVEEVKGDVQRFLNVVDENSELKAILRNPIISPDKKIAILNSIFGASMHQMILGFFKIVISKGRSEILYGTAKEFINEYNIRKGIFKVSVTSAAPSSPENMKQIKNIIKESVHGEVVLETIVDPKLIGGSVLTVGDKQVDTSIAHSLSKLKKEFAQKVVA